MRKSYQISATYTQDVCLFFGLFEEQYMVSKFDGNERKFNYWAITERGDGLLLVSNCKFLWLSIKV